MIGWSEEFVPGTVKAMKYLGSDLVAYRTYDGRLSVLDAYCPHMGAHLGYGGCVDGETKRRRKKNRKRK
jgi:phenylpropionate dioxygenase-like ring-hydroxylating dioxygenase large terminal subunit